MRTDRPQASTRSAPGASWAPPRQCIACTCSCPLLTHMARATAPSLPCWFRATWFGFEIAAAVPGPHAWAQHNQQLHTVQQQCNPAADYSYKHRGPGCSVPAALVIVVHGCVNVFVGIRVLVLSSRLPHDLLQVKSGWHALLLLCDGSERWDNPITAADAVCQAQCGLEGPDEPKLSLGSSPESPQCHKGACSFYTRFAVRGGA